MASVEKFTLNDCPRLLAHCSRTQKNQGSHIDKNRTILNFNLANRENPELTDYQFLKKKITQDNVKMMKRDDVKAACSWAISLPQELCHESVDDRGEAYYTPNNAEECKAFFKYAYEFFAKKHGEQNIISANVHMDENKPHMHFIFTPIVPEKNGHNLKVCAKEALSDCYGAKFQIELQDYISEKMGRSLKMVSSETVNYERNVKELKKKTLNQRCTYLAKQINIEEERLNRMRRANDIFEKSLEESENMPKPHISSSNGFTVMRDSDWENIKAQLKLINRMKAERREILKMLNEFKDTNISRERDSFQEEANNLMKENQKLQNELDKVQQFLNNTKINGTSLNNIFEEEQKNQKKKKYKNYQNYKEDER